MTDDNPWGWREDQAEVDRAAEQKLSIANLVDILSEYLLKAAEYPSDTFESLVIDKLAEVTYEPKRHEFYTEILRQIREMDQLTDKLVVALDEARNAQTATENK